MSYEYQIYIASILLEVIEGPSEFRNRIKNTEQKNTEQLMRIPVIRVIVDSGDGIPRKDGLKAKMPRMQSLTQKVQILLKRRSLNGKRSE